VAWEMGKEADGKKNAGKEIRLSWFLGEKEKGGSGWGSSPRLPRWGRGGIEKESGQ